MQKRSVACVAFINQKQEIFLVQTYKHPGHWQPTGGEFDEREESPEDAAIRECKEETGVNIRSIDLRHIMNAPFDFGEGTVYFYTTSYQDDGELCLQKDEIKESGWFSLHEVQDLTVYPATRRFLDELRGILG